MFALPKVTTDNGLEFDPTGPVPESLPLFVRDKINPCLFHPLFQECDFRKTIKRPLTVHPTCVRKRNVWYCTYFGKDVFPLDCDDCTVPREKLGSI